MRARIHLRLIASIALSAAVGVACSLTTSFDGLTTNAVPDAAGPTPPADAGGAEGATTTGEAGPSTDGSTLDAAPVPSFSCADHPTAAFCADFEAIPVTTGWVQVKTVAGGTMTSAAGRFGQGLSSTTPAHDGSTEPSAWLESDSLSIGARQDFTFSIDMMLGSLKGGQTDFVGFGYHGPFYILTLRGEGDGKVDLYEYGDAIGMTPALDHYQPLLVQPTIGSWVHVVGHVTFSATTVHLTMTFDGVTAFDGMLGASPYAGHPYAHAGISQSTGLSNQETVLFDDVLVTSP